MAADFLQNDFCRLRQGCQRCRLDRDWWLGMARAWLMPEQGGICPKGVFADAPHAPPPSPTTSVSFLKRPPCRHLGGGAGIFLPCKSCGGRKHPVRTNCTLLWH